MPVTSSAPRRKASSSHLDHELKLIASCPIMAAQTLLRGRWKIPLIWNLRDQRKTLAEFRRVFVIASEKMLTQHLAELVRDGFVERRESARDRRDVSYSLTDLGESLLPTLETLRVWGESQDVITRATSRLAGTDAESKRVSPRIPATTFSR